MTGTMPLLLPSGISSRQVETAAGLSMHVLEAGVAGHPALLLLHGFPEIAYSWRKVMLPLAEAGYHVIAPDQRGYGRTVGWPEGYDIDLTEFSTETFVRDAVALLDALEIDAVHAVIGHDFGARDAAWIAFLRPDRFRRCALMSTPFPGAPAIGAPDRSPQAALAALARPRSHYQWYYSERRANDEMMGAPQGLHAFLRAYFHMKSADWPGNRPHRLAAWSAEELAKLPTYYVMDLADDMPAAVTGAMPGAAEIAACRWLPEEELAVYTAEYARTGFQGGLNCYRTWTEPRFQRALSCYAGKRIEVPVCFIGGTQDWGTYQAAGALEKMETQATADYRGTVLIAGAGHWIQQEQPEALLGHLLPFLDG